MTARLIDDRDIDSPQVERAMELYQLDILVHRYPEAAQALVAALAAPTPLEQAVMDDEEARLKERLA